MKNRHISGFEFLGVLLLIGIIVTYLISYIINPNKQVEIFGEYKITQYGNEISLKDSKGMSINGREKSGIIDNGKLYFAYYYPYINFGNNGDGKTMISEEMTNNNIGEYNSGMVNLNVNRIPLYIVINKGNGKIIKLNKDYTVISGSGVDYNKELLVKLSKTNIIKIGKINLLTEVDKSIFTESNNEIENYFNKVYSKIINYSQIGNQ